MRFILIVLVAIFHVGCNDGESVAEPSENLTTVFKNNGSIQCGSNGLSEVETAQQLIEGGIDVIASQCGILLGRVVAAQCGLNDININLHIINNQNISDAQSLGFEPVISLKQNSNNGFAIMDCQNAL